jgi:hypothetical protein
MSLWTVDIVSKDSKVIGSECIPQSMGNMTEESKESTCVINECDYVNISLLVHVLNIPEHVPEWLVCIVYTDILTIPEHKCPPRG